VSQDAILTLEGESYNVPALPDPAKESDIEADKPRLVSVFTLTFPPAFTITSPSTNWGEVMVKAGGTNLLSSRSRALTLTSHPHILRKSLFHHLEHRVESHIFLCVLAYHLLVAIETTLLRQEIHTSWATVRDVLATHEVATIVLPTDQDGVLRIRRSATPEQNHRVLYEALGVPSEIIRPVKTWERKRKHSDWKNGWAPCFKPFPDLNCESRVKPGGWDRGARAGAVAMSDTDSGRTNAATSPMLVDWGRSASMNSQPRSGSWNRSITGCRSGKHRGSAGTIAGSRCGACRSTVPACRADGSSLTGGWCE
jgi:hypothetical protein